MNKLTKVLSVFIIAGAIGAGVTGAAGCAHKHSYSDDYTSAGAEGHYHVATCKHTDQHTEIEAHEYDNDQDTTCNKCDYVRTLETPGTSDVAVTEVSITGADTVEVDKSIQLTAVITPSNATNKSVSWDIVEGAEFAEISASGLLTAYSETGTVKVKATAGGKSATKTITITEAHVEETPTVSSVAISGESTVKVNATLTLTATVSGTGNFAQTVTWTVTNGTGEATISESGVLTPSKAGTVTVKATSTADSTKFAEKAITIAELTRFDELSSRNNCIYSSDYSQSETIGIFNGTFGKKGLYTDKQGFLSISDGVVKQAADQGANYNTIISFGPIADNSVVEGMIDITPSDMGSKWNILRFHNETDSVFSLRVGDSKGSFANKLVYSLDGGTTECAGETTITPAKDITYSVYYKIDLSSGKITVEIDGKAFVTDLAANIHSVCGLKVVSGGSGARLVAVDNVVVCGNEMTAAEYAVKAKASLDADYASYAIGETTSLYKINGERVTAAYNKGVTAIQKENASIDEIAEALITATREMAAVLSDVQITDAQNAACTQLDNDYPAASYTKTGLTDDPNFPDYPDSQYNNKEKYETALAAAKAEIRTKTNRIDIDAALAKHKALLDAIKTDTQVITAKIAEAQHRIEVYLADEIAALEGGEFNATYLELVRLKKEEGTELLPQWRTVAEINQKLANLKSRIDDIYATTQMQLEDVIRANKESLTDYVTEQLAKFNASVADDKEVIDLIQGMDGNGGVQKDGLDAIDAATTRGEANAALIKARTTIAFMVTRGEAVQRIKTYSDGLKEGYYLNTALELFDTEAAKHIANAKAIAVPSTDGDTWEEGFETANQNITDVRLAAREALDGTVAKATELELAARDTWSGTVSVEKHDTYDFKTLVSGKKNGATVAASELSGAEFIKSFSGLKWKTEGGINAKSATITITAPSDNCKLVINYYSTSSGRKFTLTDAANNPVGAGTPTTDKHTQTAGEYEAAYWGAETDYEIELSTAGDYKLVFCNAGDHKLASLGLKYSETKQVTAKVNKLTAVNDGANTVVTAELELDDKSTTTVILSASEYTVIGNTVIYGTGKTADDANKYNSCEITNA